MLNPMNWGSPSAVLVAWLSLVSVVLTILGGAVAIYVALKVRELHVTVDGRLSELLSKTAGESRALGDAEGVERERGDERDRKEKAKGEAS
jgi:hypothetical protein